MKTEELTKVKISKEKLSARGIISRENIEAKIARNNGLGIRFIIQKEANEDMVIAASISNLYSTQRNTVIANDKGECVCLIEHFLAACALLDVNNIDLYINEAELPFADGASMFWVEFLELNGFAADEKIATQFELKEEISFYDENDESKYITLKPAEEFSVSYLLDWDHPLIGKQEYCWQAGVASVSELARARTFSNEKENQMLGLNGWVLGFTDEKFTQELYFENEPARHKALDLLGDLMLSGINPLQVKMQVISHKGGHSLNSKAAKYLSELFFVKEASCH